MADILLIVPHYLSLPDLLVVVEQFVSHGRYLHVLRKFNVRSSTLTSLSVMIPNGNIFIVLNNRFHADTSYIRPLLRPNLIPGDHDLKTKTESALPADVPNKIQL